MNRTIYKLSDVFLEISNILKKYEDNLNITQEKKKVNSIYSINDVITLYPCLSKHIITKHINEGSLPVIRVGNHRYFYKEDIENILQAKPEKICNKLNIRRNNE